MSISKKGGSGEGYAEDSQQIPAESLTAMRYGASSNFTVPSVKGVPNKYPISSLSIPSNTDDTTGIGNISSPNLGIPSDLVGDGVTRLTLETSENDFPRETGSDTLPDPLMS